MLTKICGRCGRKIKINEQCECQKQRYKEYDRHSRNKDSAAIYHSKMWKLLSDDCKRKCNGLDMYALHIKHILVKGTLSHHIVEITENNTRAYDQSNLIYLSDKSHAEIHETYKKSEMSKGKMQGILFDILKAGGGT
ncbi:hypothetical protein [Pectinatus frisingensis]|uniref:hypothetical protein n=1 Tax=Pectinatus frisingensis TaxID=865 RepID=UPI0018C457B8|nr:hypothetical protein [Pectinatus frisingensis]